MRAGKLDRLVTVQRELKSPLDAYGVPEATVLVEGGADDGSDATWPTWVAVCTMRAELVSGGQEETIKPDFGAATESVLTFKTRYFPGLSVAHRLLFEGQLFHIKSVTEIGRRRGLEIRAIARGLP